MWGEADHVVGEETREAIRRAVPANTARAYTRQWAAFQAWCASRGRRALPATGATLTEYAAVLCRAGYAAASVEQAVAAVRVAHRRTGYPGAPEVQGAELLPAEHREALAQAGRRAKQAKALDIDEIRAMLDRCDAAAAAGLRDRVIITVGANLMGRRSELSDLDIVDVEFTDDGMLVYVRKSKTDQQAPGREVAVLAGVHADSDPARLTRAWLETLAQHGIEAGPLLRAAGRGGRLSPDAIHRIVRRRARQAGITDWEKVGAHSLRATGAEAVGMAGRARWGDRGARRLEADVAHRARLHPGREPVEEQRHARHRILIARVTHGDLRRCTTLPLVWKPLTAPQVGRRHRWGAVNETSTSRQIVDLWH